MDATVPDLELALKQVLSQVNRPGCPPRLAAAMQHAVFPGGARVRPKLCLAVAQAEGGGAPELTMAAAIAIELLHCASLVHDDLPCFDDADLRRGVPAVHKAFGERLAVLAGDALIVLAFQELARAVAAAPVTGAAAFACVAEGVGMPFGIVAGQAWECESRVSLEDYQQAKTGALFAAATAAGAAAVGGSSETWAHFGARLGQAYQVADDIRDVIADPWALGKPVGQDEAHGRPSSAAQLGLVGAIDHFDELVEKAIGAIPLCAGAEVLAALVRAEAERLLPAAQCAQQRALFAA